MLKEAISMKSSFPNIVVLLQIACAVPVTSCECERSASALRRLHTFNRAGMKEDRLTSLALMHIHYTFPIDMDEIINIFKTVHPRRFELDDLLA